MKNRPRILAVICLQIFVVACGAQTGKVRQKKTVDPVKTVKNPKLWLNHQSMGDVEDPSKLAETLSRIMKDREDEGVLSDGGVDRKGPLRLPANGLYVLVAPDVSMGDLAKIYKIAAESCKVQIPKRAPDKPTSDEVEMAPNPLVLVLGVGTNEVLPGSLRLPDVDSENKFSFDLSIDTITDEKNLWLDRVTGSVEIQSDGNVIVNERDFRGNESSMYPPKQRSVKSSLKEEIAGLSRESGIGRDAVYVIVSPSASFKSLKEILKQADDLNLETRILVSQVE